MIEIVVIPVFWLYCSSILRSRTRLRFENIISILPSLLVLPFLPVFFALLSLHYFQDILSLLLILAIYKNLLYFVKDQDPLSNYIEELLDFAVPLYSEADSIIYLLTLLISGLVSHFFQTVF
jgi:hypothetical protein